MQHLKHDIKTVMKLVKLGLAAIALLTITVLVIGVVLISNQKELDYNTAQNKIDKEYKEVVDRNTKNIKDAKKFIDSFRDAHKVENENKKMIDSLNKYLTP